MNSTRLTNGSKAKRPATPPRLTPALTKAIGRYIALHRRSVAAGGCQGDLNLFIDAEVIAGGAVLDLVYREFGGGR